MALELPWKKSAKIAAPPAREVEVEISEGDIAELARRGEAFREKLYALKASLQPRGFEWYPYESLTNLEHLDKLLTGPNRRLLELIGTETALDIGCADGDMSFFLESLGCKVHAVDTPLTNHNGMAGVRALKAALQSGVDILDVDLDSLFLLPELRYRLAFFLGTLYHLKNPFSVLEALSKRARYCLLSTRVTARVPRCGADLRDVPMAYLVDELELNSDRSNFWIFTEAGLRRLLKRAQWEVLDYLVVGEAQRSDPVRADRDQRAFCLARSLYGLENVELLHGWHDREGMGWCWTERRFAARLHLRHGHRPATLRLRWNLPQLVAERCGGVTLSARVNGVDLAPQQCPAPGDYAYVQPLSEVPLEAGVLDCEFSLDKALAPGEADSRELGIIAVSLEVD